MKQVLPRALLGVSGLMLLAIGLSVLFNPVSFAAANGFELPAGPSALSEYRAPGGVLVVSAVVILLSLVHRRQMQLGLMLAESLYELNADVALYQPGSGSPAGASNQSEGGAERRTLLLALLFH